MREFFGRTSWSGKKRGFRRAHDGRKTIPKAFGFGKLDDLALTSRHNRACRLGQFPRHARVSVIGRVVCRISHKPCVPEVTGRFSGPESAVLRALRLRLIRRAHRRSLERRMISLQSRATRAHVLRADRCAGLSRFLGSGMAPAPHRRSLFAREPRAGVWKAMAAAFSAPVRGAG